MRSPAEGSFGPRTPGGADLAPPDAGGQLPELFWRLTTRLGCMILPVTTASHHLKSGKRLPQCRTEPPLTAAAKPPAAPSRSTCERPGSRHPQRQYWCGIASAAPTAGLLPAGAGCSEIGCSACAGAGASSWRRRPAQGAPAATPRARRHSHVSLHCFYVPPSEHKPSHMAHSRRQRRVAGRQRPPEGCTIADLPDELLGRVLSLSGRQAL